MDNEQLYKLVFELAVGDISKCPEDNIYYTTIRTMAKKFVLKTLNIC